MLLSKLSKIKLGVAESGYDGLRNRHLSELEIVE
jgi:hypothetical protein